MPPDFGASVTLLADVSEFQPNIADATYLSSFSKAIVIRAMYGDAHDDKAWYGGARRADLLAGGARFVGIYQYVVASQDITAQAMAFCKLLGGKLNKGEVSIADIEEGGGSQFSRWRTWNHVVSSELGFGPWDYSGANFAANAGLIPVDWVAAYGSSEPAQQHTLWQFTDRYNVPGVGTADCSVFHGTIDQLAALAYGGTQPAPKAYPAPTGLRVNGMSVTVHWDPVTVAGQPVASYTVEAVQMNGTVAVRQTSPANSALLSGLVHGWQYEIRVWANGGPVSPPHASLKIIV